jgi:hypothetical protein
MTTSIATPVFSTGPRAGSAIVPLADVAHEFGLHPSRLYNAALAGQVQLIRVGERLAGERWALEAAAASCKAAP